MKVLGLTGSIGMGKSTAARLLRRMGLAVHDADSEVHRLLAPGGGAVAAVAAAFPGVVAGGAVDRAALGRLVFADPAALRRLEAILHPRVRRAEAAFLRRHARRHAVLVVLDVPLLLETGGGRRCDAVAVVTAPAFLQAQRVLKRPGMTPERLARVRAQQMADSDKIRRADFVIPTGTGLAPALRRLARAVTVLRTRPGRGAWPPRPGACHA
jgi:dephospho-CoA kinase